MGFGDVVRESVELISSLFDSGTGAATRSPDHLGVRVPWHDARWDGTVCRAPGRNAFCMDLESIRDTRDDVREDELAGRHFADLATADLPPCRTESGAFMSSREWWLTRSHPYATLKKAASTHGTLRPTSIRMEPYSTLAVPFWWMLRQNQDAVDRRTADSLPQDEEPPFPSAWVFGRERQEAIGDRFFGRLAAGSSLAVFYTKGGHPVGEHINRLVVGIGRIDHVGTVQRYDSDGASTYPLWERPVRHSIRPDGTDGFLVPYHDYLSPTGDPAENARREELLQEIALVPDPAHIAAYSYAGELAGPDITLSTAVRALDVLRAIRRHGIAPGPWAGREEWLNDRIATLWRDRGSFPGTGAALEALGLRLGTALFHELVASGTVKPDDDPWPVVDALFRGRIDPPDAAFQDDIAATSRTWTGLSDQRRELLVLLSRFAMSSAQARRWFDPALRAKAIRGACTDADVLANPYRIVECDLGDATERPVTVGVLDRGVMPEDTIAARHPLPESSRVPSPTDWRRVRAGMVAVLRRAADDGDALLARDELRSRLGMLDLSPQIELAPDWPDAHVGELAGEIELVATGGAIEIPSLQLTEHRASEDKLRSILGKRAGRALPSTKVNWAELIRAALPPDALSEVSDGRGAFALEEQARALEAITTRRLSVLVGRAGSGKTTVLSALLAAPDLSGEGVLFLAPTGKASVQIAVRAPHAEVRTVASFLYSLGRYDGERQRPRFTGPDTYRGARTVVIDEASMLTMDSLQALLAALDLAHVRRVILVGDPNQLPPIGVGRPFADLVAHLDELADEDPASAALARLTTELRTRAGGDSSDALRLAAWYTRESQAVDADSVLDALDRDGPALNDLSVRVWRNPEELYAHLDDLFVESLGLTAPDDLAGFNKILGLTPEGWVPFGEEGAPDSFQILSPVRQHAHGVHDLNRRIQGRFRAAQLAKASGRGGVALGDERIVWGDKIILNRNGQRKGWDFGERAEVKKFLANGEVGFVGKDKTLSSLSAKFARRTDLGFRFWRNEFGGGAGPLSLAYALTIHKSQGSEFGTVFVVVPQRSRLLSRELIYTALTRARNRVVLLVESDMSTLHGLTLPERSETARRNTNLFTGAVRAESVGVPYAGHLIHRTLGGVLVRSKSELVIANHLENKGIDYRYEAPLVGDGTKDRRWPDFTFVSDAGDLVVWEHLGMLDRPDYRAAWERKRRWYDDNGFAEGIDLFTTADRDGALDSYEISETAKRVAEALA